MLDGISVTLIIGLIAACLVIILLTMGYVKAPPDMAYIISGMKRKSKVVIGKEITGIGAFAFWGASNLKAVEFEAESVLARIEKYAFARCTSLTDIKLPE